MLFKTTIPYVCMRQRSTHTEPKLYSLTWRSFERSPNQTEIQRQGGFKYSSDNYFLGGFQTSHEVSSDVVNARYRRWTSFEHYKCSIEPAAMSGGVAATGYWRAFLSKTTGYESTQFADPYVGFSGSPFGQMGEAGISQLAPYINITASPEFIPEPPLLSDHLQRAFAGIMPGIKQELSILNTLFELKDFRRLPDTLANVLRLRFVGNRTLSGFARAVSDVYLQQQFNIGPLLSDIRGVITALGNVEASLRKLINNANQMKTRHCNIFVENGDASDELSSDYFVSLNERPFGILGKAKLRRIVIPVDHVFHVEVQLTYKLTRHQLEHARVLALLDAIGINSNPAIIWNAIPWTFVVDWVIGVNRWLSQWRTQLMEPTVNIHRCLWSWKRSRRIHLLKTMGENVYEIPMASEHPVFVTTESSYKRKVFTPTVATLSSSGLSPKEISLGAALVFARKPRPRKW